MADKALLVGINKYPGSPLEGCVNDITDITALITSTSTFAFDPLGVRMLLDGRATSAGIRERLTWLVSDSKAGDRLLFYFSGHGVQMAVRNDKGEPDKLDEAICPVDFDWSEGKAIRDDELIAIMAKAHPEAHLMWVSDSCHSGDLSRGFLGLGGRVARRMLPPPDVEWRRRSAAMVSRDLTKASETSTFARPGQHKALLLSGCQSNQTSADARFGLKRRPNGAMSYFLHAELKANPRARLAEVVAKVRLKLKAKNFDQIPQLEGAGANNRSFLPQKNDRT